MKIKDFEGIQEAYAVMSYLGTNKETEIKKVQIEKVGRQYVYTSEYIDNQYCVRPHGILCEYLVQKGYSNKRLFLSETAAQAYMKKETMLRWLRKHISSLDPDMYTTEEVYMAYTALKQTGDHDSEMPEIKAIVFEYGKDDYALCADFSLTKEEKAIIARIMTNHSTEGSSVRGTLVDTIEYLK